MVVLSLLLFSSFTISTKAISKEINLLSYNVYFDDESGEQRYPEIIKLIANENYNVISLQECTPKFIQMLINNEKIKYYYRQIGDERHGYTNVILTSLDILNSGNIKLPTEMGRSAPYIILRDSSFRVVGVHLESGMFDSDMRMMQINTILNETESDSNVIISGDFNFDDGDDEELLFSDYHDTGKSKSQPTYTPDLNPFAHKTKFPFEDNKRLDRIFVKCKTCKPQQFDIDKNSHSDHWAISSLIIL